MEEIKQFPCSADWDCPGTKLCYDTEHASWLPEGINSTCGCSSYWGWQGPSCTALSPQIAIISAFAIGVGTLGLVALLINIRIIVSIFLLGHTRKWNNSNATLIFTTISLTSLVCWRACTVTVLFTPEKNVLFLSNSDEKLHSVLPFEKVFLSIAVIFATLSSISISISWIDIVEKSTKLLPTSTGIFADHKVKIYLFGFCFLGAIVAGSLQGKTELGVAIASPFVIILILSYVYAQHKLGSLLLLMGESVAEEPETLTKSSEQVSAPEGRGSISKVFQRARGKSLEKNTLARRRRITKNKYMELLGKVRFTSRAVIISLSLLVIDALAYSIPTLVLGWKELCPLDGFICITTLLNELISIFVLFTVAALQKFIYDNFQLQFARLRRMRSESGFSSSERQHVGTGMATSSPRQLEESSFASPDQSAVRPMSL